MSLKRITIYLFSCSSLFSFQDIKTQPVSNSTELEDSDVKLVSFDGDSFDVSVEGSKDARARQYNDD